MGISSTRNTQISNQTPNSTMSSTTTATTAATSVTIPIGNYNTEQVKKDIEKVSNNGLSNAISGSSYTNDSDIQTAFLRNVDNLEDVQENSEIKNTLKKAINKFKSFLAQNNTSANNINGATKTGKASELAKSMSNEEIQQALKFVSSHTDGIDDESADFKSLPKNIQNYIRATANDVQSEDTNKVENSDADLKLKATEQVLN